MGEVNRTDGHRPWLLAHPRANPYFAFTDDCNATGPVVLLASGQACVWYRLTLASKDGDWIIAEQDTACASVLDRLATMCARYRVGAPLHPRWLAAGWSSHFEAISSAGERLRFDFVSRPPRVSAVELATLWAHASTRPAVVPPEILISLKQTMRLKDYPFIGALALRLEDPADQLRTSIEPQHISSLLMAHPSLRARLPDLRPALVGVGEDADAVGAAIDHEIRSLRAADERRMAAYASAMQPWAEHFRKLPTERLPLLEAHAMLCDAAGPLLPDSPP